MIRTLTNLAQVAKLVDALASGASGGNSVEVQVLSWAPVNTLNMLQYIQMKSKK